jgi:hypothetical protein
MSLADPHSSPCNELFPSFGFPRLVAGGPLAANNLQCRLKPIDPDDYAVSFTPAELERLRGIFPTGVCDWSKRGVVPWGFVRTLAREPGIRRDAPRCRRRRRGRRPVVTVMISPRARPPRVAGWGSSAARVVFAALPLDDQPLKQ